MEVSKAKYELLDISCLFYHCLGLPSNEKYSYGVSEYLRFIFTKKWENAHGSVRCKWFWLHLTSLILIVVSCIVCLYNCHMCQPIGYCWCVPGYGVSYECRPGWFKFLYYWPINNFLSIVIPHWIIRNMYYTLRTCTNPFWIEAWWSLKKMWAILFPIFSQWSFHKALSNIRLCSIWREH